MKIRAWAALAAVLLSTPASAATVARFAFDEGDGSMTSNAADSDHPGVITGASWAEGADGKALKFAGPDYSGPYKPPGTFVTVKDSAAMNPAKKVVVKAKIHPTSWPVAWGSIVEKGVGYTSSFRLVLLRSGKLRGTIGNAHAAVDSSEPIPRDTWTTVEMSYDGKNLRLKVDGQEVGATVVETEDLTSEHPIEIGRRFTGRIDDVEIEF